MRLSVTILCALALPVALMAGAAPARAGDLADFNAAVEAASSHNRVAIGYLRTGNTDLASLEVDRLRAAWHKLTARFAGHRPDAFDGNPLYPKLFTTVDARLVGADMMLTSGRAKLARQSLIAIRDDLHALRQKSGIVVLADCIADAAKAGAAFMAYDKPGLDLGKPATSYAVAGKAAVYGHELARCDRIASEAVRKDPEFRRLIDGAQHSLTFVPQAIRERDSNLYHRVVGELRAIDRLLSFRFG
jgi:hypothetical protein